jgi:hypothetical protein
VGWEKLSGRGIFGVRRLGAYAGRRQPVKWFGPGGPGLKVIIKYGPRDVLCGKVLWRGAMGWEIQAGRRILGLCRGYRDL